jgi:hypothetical protein
MGAMRNDSSDSGPPVVFQDLRSGVASDQRRGSSELRSSEIGSSEIGSSEIGSEGSNVQPRAPLQADWRDFVAITVAVYQVLLGPLLLIVAGIVGVYLLFLWLAR